MPTALGVMRVSHHGTVQYSTIQHGNVASKACLLYIAQGQDRSLVQISHSRPSKPLVDKGLDSVVSHSPPVLLTTCLARHRSCSLQRSSLSTALDSLQNASSSCTLRPIEVTGQFCCQASPVQQHGQRLRPSQDDSDLHCDIRCCPCAGDAVVKSQPAVSLFRRASRLLLALYDISSSSCSHFRSYTSRGPRP